MFVVDGRVFIFDWIKYSLQLMGIFNFQFECIGYMQEGFGLDWSLDKFGWLVIGSEDNIVMVWDLNLYSGIDKKVRFWCKYIYYSYVVNDVQYNLIILFWIGIVLDDVMM